MQIYSVAGTLGFTALIKAYDRDTVQIKLKLRTLKNVSQPSVILQSQHAPAVQAKPKRLIGLDLDINNQGTTGLGPAVGFEYYRDAVLTATSTNNLWTGIRLRGIHEQAPVVSTTQNTLAAAGTLDTDELVLLNGSLSSIYRRTGLINSKQRSHVRSGGKD